MIQSCPTSLDIKNLERVARTVGIPKLPQEIINLSNELKKNPHYGKALNTPKPTYRAQKAALIALQVIVVAAVVFAFILNVWAGLATLPMAAFATYMILKRFKTLNTPPSARLNPNLEGARRFFKTAGGPIANKTQVAIDKLMKVTSPGGARIRQAFLNETLGFQSNLYSWIRWAVQATNALNK